MHYLRDDISVRSFQHCKITFRQRWHTWPNAIINDKWNCVICYLMMQFTIFPHVWKRVRVSVFPSNSCWKDSTMKNINSDYPNAKPAYPPGLIKRTSSRLGKILKNVTIEPAVFLISFSTNMDDVTLSQMTLYKSCINDFQFDNGTCSNLVNDFEANSAVQKEVILISFF